MSRIRSEKKKLQKLTDMARLYYIQDLTQNEIAKQYGVSRPLISRMLQDAKKLGIVKVEICPPFDESAIVTDRAVRFFDVQDVRTVTTGSDDAETNVRLVESALEYMKELKQASLGIGWGPMIGNMVSYLESKEPMDGLVYRVCPLIGNGGVGNRNYHSNELARIFAERCHAAAEYFFAPYMMKSKKELEAVRDLESGKAIRKAWSGLDMALVNIGDYPSVPDFASEARFGDKLNKGEAVGQILNYYFDLEGNIFESDKDYSLQIPVETLQKVPHVIGLCSASTNPKALVGALRTGLIRHLVAPEPILRAATEIADEQPDED